VQSAEFILLLEKINTPIGWIFSFFIFILPLMIGTARRLLLFHNGDIRHYRIKNFELALSKLKEGSVEYDLLNECKNQELVYINTKLNLSKSERAQVLEWLHNSPVTVNLIKKAWPNIRHKNGQLVPQTNLFDKFFMWYSCITAVLCVMLGTYALVVLIEPIVKQGVYQYFGASIIPYLFAIFIFKQAESVFSARSLINRLNKMTS
jgi:hypothetical protein